MNTVFLKLFNMSVMAGWLILAVLVFRLLFKKAPRWIFCVFWALVAIRLVCPATIESVWSVIPSAETISTSGETATPVVQSGVQIVDKVANQYIGEHFVRHVVTAEAKKPVDPTNVFAGIWLLGVVLLTAHGIISYVRLKKTVAASITIRGRIKECDDIRFPFILGVLRPTIYLPSLFDEETRYYVVHHEESHLKRGDHLWKPLGYFILTIHWFNPLCWIAYILFCRDVEMACDERVIKFMDNDSKAGYSQTLLNLSNPRRMISACPVAFGEVGVKMRVKGVLNYKKPAFWLVTVSVVCCIVAVVCFLTNPRKAAAASVSDGDLGEGISASAEEISTQETVTVDNVVSQEDSTILENSTIVEDTNIQEENDVWEDGAPQEEDYIWDDGDYEANIEEPNIPAEDKATFGNIDGIGNVDINLKQYMDPEEGYINGTTWEVLVNNQTVFTSGNEWMYASDLFSAYGMDLDQDGQKELVVVATPMVNSYSFQNYVVLKNVGGTWTQLMNSYAGQVNEDGDPSNAFPVQVTMGSTPGMIDVALDGCNTITVDERQYYADMMEFEGDNYLGQLAKDVLQNNTYKAGNVFGRSAGWGLWSVEPASYNGVDCLKAVQGICSIEGQKGDVLGTLDIFFNYDSNGQIHVLDMKFHQNNPYEDLR